MPAMISQSINVFDEVHNNPMTAVGSQYSKLDVQNVWRRLAEYILDKLKENKGIIVKGLGTFSLSTWTLETGNNRRTLEVRRPIFVLSKCLAEDFDLHQRKQYVNDAVPFAPVCSQELASRCKLSKDKVIGCIEETLQCFRRIISERRDVEFPLPPLGNLTIIKTNVSFTFYDCCELKIPQEVLPCSRFSIAKVEYKKKFTVPCSAHAGNHF